MPGPMSGIKVVELGVWVVGPSVAALLADWGADVVKIEPPAGDPGRAWTTDRNPVFELDNRGKRSITLDLWNDVATEVAGKLLGAADVFVTNLRPAALVSLAMDDATLVNAHPGLVYAHVTGYGSSGSERDRPAYDAGAFWSRAGVFGAMTPPGAPLPHPPGGSGDHVTSLAALGGVAAALYARQQTGRGQVVSTSLLRAGIFTVGSDVNMALRLGTTFAPRPRTEAPNPLYNAYRTSDDRWLFLLGLQPDRHWEPVLEALGRRDLLEDDRFTTTAARAQNAPELIALMSEEFTTRDFASWSDRLDEVGVWWAPVQTPLDVIDDPAATGSGAFVSVPVTEGTGTMVAGPVDFSGTPWEVSRRAPEAGEHTEEILLELGYDWNAISGLRAAGALG
ncbi:MAG TPA: CaiB/BaiF CoA-transferase family protein [Acidimicrobiales bacterium]|nr:CaiB/BaiF CoA-transferase family protein [Acidimicrobiales bacterium]